MLQDQPNARIYLIGQKKQHTIALARISPRTSLARLCDRDTTGKRVFKNGNEAGAGSDGRSWVRLDGSRLQRKAIDNGQDMVEFLGACQMNLEKTGYIRYTVSDLFDESDDFIGWNL